MACEQEKQESKRCYLQLLRLIKRTRQKVVAIVPTYPRIEQRGHRFGPGHLHAGQRDPRNDKLRDRGSSGQGLRQGGLECNAHSPFGGVNVCRRAFQLLSSAGG